MFRIDATRLDLAREYRDRPYGEHSPELQAILNVMRRPDRAEGYILIRTAEGFQLATSRKGSMPVEIEGAVFATLEAAEWFVFRRRWRELTGAELVLP